MPTIAELLLAELEREAIGTRRMLERVPEGKDDWKPHPKSMPLGYLAALVATMPGWVAAMINQDELDVTAAGEHQTRSASTNRELLQKFDKALDQARAALSATTDEHLMTSWRMLAQGHVVSEQPRYVAIRDGALNHLAHHRGQLTVYLRLNEIPVPSLYGPTADERGF
ncbi:MAG: damage-inducible protein DinB [Acidobacteria bacterium]|nr:damage-inducible protein DinB [Acidobacteriota bacterium]